jgi:myosin heavy subunit
MDKFLSSFIKVEKSLQIFALLSVMLLLGYLEFVNDRGNQAPSPGMSPTIQK